MSLRDLESLGLKTSGRSVYILDQTKLPHEEAWLDATRPKDMIAAIRALKVRGAPLIGVAAALSLGYWAQGNGSEASIREAAQALRAARPTAVNLMGAIDRMMAAIPLGSKALLQTAYEIFDEDVRLCRRMGEEGAGLISDGDRILTHCNTGGLATAGIGTALGVIRAAHEQGKRIHVFVDETRPLLQGARLTAWELRKLGIPYTLLCDNMAASLMSEGRVQKVIVGSDRIARNGDFANKIGTYALAIVAHHHRVPFYVAAPQTTVDPGCPSGREIPIEQRGPSEVARDWAPKDSAVYNPAFDVTPAWMVTGFIGCVLPRP
ncbi:MAG TPA: S-methyl-5-thioribose-1-phosphate isomerase [Bdellovibrionales bacterium]|nr:S-methyl-5-thioribose-1-phosphate isomerase [Bdellovibrionales bacterium]